MRTAAEVGRDPATLTRSLGLYALAGENERDLAARYARLQANTPAGILDDVPLERFRADKLVGTVEQIQEQAEEWAELGVESLILGVGAVPFQLGSLEDLELLADALCSNPGTEAD